MSIDPEIARQILREEVEGMAELANSYAWEIVPDYSSLKVTVRMISQIDQECYVVEARCDDYKAFPPYFEFIHPASGARGTRECYPQGSSYFHSAPCICVQWNRKAYKSEGGPHADWSMTNWMSQRPGTRTLGDMFHLIQVQINKQGEYRGRMT